MYFQFTHSRMAFITVQFAMRENLVASVVDVFVLSKVDAPVGAQDP